MQYVIIYLIICIIEAFTFKKLCDSGEIDKIEDKAYGTEAWKHRTRSMIPDDSRIAIPVLILTFIIATPLLVLAFIFNPIIKLFKK